ncbi:hypothetical protein [Maritalea myrionectae]|uniref:hypothetical protein n=1 Tax=Maritalea myrionectae TaxID=454601 RepID=UPI0004012555|nr:hypothetical protein [Maritalea myrionectae]
MFKIFFVHARAATAVVFIPALLFCFFELSRIFVLPRETFDSSFINWFVLKRYFLLVLVTLIVSNWTRYWVTGTQPRWILYNKNSFPSVPVVLAFCIAAIFIFVSPMIWKSAVVKPLIDQFNVLGFLFSVRILGFAVILIFTFMAYRAFVDKNIPLFSIVLLCAFVFATTYLIHHLTGYSFDIRDKLYAVSVTAVFAPIGFLLELLGGSGSSEFLGLAMMIFFYVATPIGWVLSFFLYWYLFLFVFTLGFELLEWSGSRLSLKNKTAESYDQK